MTTYEPGRIYCGIPKEIDQRVIFMVTDSGDAIYYSAARGITYEDAIEDLTDIRGPLVVLDLSMVGSYVPEMIECLNHNGFGAVAIQIEEQTRPAPERGWHEVEDVPHPVYYDGQVWRYSPESRAAGSQDLISVHYIGPASGYES